LIEGIGVDIVSVERINLVYKKHGNRFLQKIFTPGEIEYCKTKKKPAEHFAARFAAKEALAKALNIAKKPGWQQVEILPGNDGPEIKIKESFLDPDLDIKLSMSHERRWAVAMVIISKEVGKSETGNR